MNTSTVYPNYIDDYDYTDMYDDNSSSICDQGPNPVFSDTVLQLFYCVVFSLGVIGKFNQMQSFK